MSPGLLETSRSTSRGFLLGPRIEVIKLPGHGTKVLSKRIWQGDDKNFISSLFEFGGQRNVFVSEGIFSALNTDNDLCK